MFNLFLYFLTLSINPVYQGIMAGVKTENAHLIRTWEWNKETDKKYDGVEYENRGDVFFLKYYNNQIKKIHYLQCTPRIKKKNIEYGLSLLKDKILEENKCLGYFKLKSKLFNASYQADLEGYYLFTFRMERKISKYLNLNALYKNNDGKKYYQLNLGLQWGL